jgi:lipopolysaccharide heptosyltransferase II
VIERLVVRAPNWLGDACLSLGAVRDLRRNFPQARITLLARPSVAPLYQAVDEVDEVIESRALRVDVAALRGRHQAAVLLPNSFQSALTARLAGIPERWGYATDGRGPLLTRRAPVPAAVRGESQVYYYRAMLAGVGLEVSGSPETRLSCPEEWRRRGSALLGDGEEDWVGLNPGAFYGTAKRWIPERFGLLGDLLARRKGCRVAILGTAAERPLAEAIAAPMQAPVRVLSGETDLPSLVGLLARLRLLVTGDSGPMHVAAALGTPVVAVFGSTDHRETGPRGGRHRLLREAVECSPCLLRECPIDHRCMRRVGVDPVLDAALDLLL